jgi:hypothetical protein
MTTSVPDEYEARTGITKAEYETRVLASARDAALQNYPPGSPDATIEAVSIEGTGTDAALVILFRIPPRPDCLFGSRTELWLYDDAEDESTPEEDGESCIAFGVEEYVDQGGLVVRQCAPDGITWLP